MADELFNNEKESPSLFDVQLDPVAQQHIAAIVQWSRIIAFLVLGMLGIAALIVVAGHGAASQETIIPGLSASEGWGMVITVVLLAVLIMGVWLYFLLRGARFLKDGLAASDSNALANGFRFMRIFFSISITLGVLSIIGSIINIF
ncbi:MAG: hypothetical protein ABS85_09765 [Sphingobacteriales bacterium SCN 48-20]|jgi:hypothetical protein|uniref:hypothetical protein n=1 Tax=Terrimonas ferruginea TaxID=249 RepID=UPI00086B5A53|nr:hypothetical protein [Terrimonas ferruginea]MBN8782048.1 hypothetical protein [Terrimonas ferruginea]ODT92387.1 MAG: hypothetical protein ABS85_09765 [Sphingobacteriales bacterium SCN 48-20]OJW45177.1 MAG: hypothetical protein BGO56_17250 [Sphingobacteriales bacterium 48-107]